MTATETATENETSTALVLIQQKDAPQYFVANGLDPIIEQIRAEVTGIVPDISTPKGRKEIASLAYKVAQSKTAVDEMGKTLTEEWKTKSKAVDAERKRWRETMDALKEEVRKPLTEWEDQEKARIAKHEADLAEIINEGRFIQSNWMTLALGGMTERFQAIQAYAAKDWQEFAARATKAIEEATASIRTAIEKREAYDKEQAELERLRREEAERQQRERDERLKAEAAEQARKEAEEKARKEAEEQAALVKAEQERQEQERLRIQQEADAAVAREEAAKRETAEAEERARKAEEDRKAAEEKAERDRIAAAEQAERDRKEAEEAAAKRERDRIAAEQRQRDEEAAKREAAAPAPGLSAASRQPST